MPKTRMLTDEALMEEASRYIGSPSRLLFSLGKRVLSSSFSLSGLDEFFDATERGYNRSCGSEIAGGLELGPLRMILADGREAEVSGVSGLAMRGPRRGQRLFWTGLLKR